MSILINLIGEQPIPNLLPVLHLKPEKTVMFFTDTTESTVKRIQKLVDNSSVYKIDAYDFNKIRDGLEDVIDKLQGELVFNLTGGTKMMAVAAYNIAGRYNSKVIYLQSEGNQSILYTLIFNKNVVTHQDSALLQELINIEYYLKAHLPGYSVDGFHKEKNTSQLSTGGLFEKAISDTLQFNGFEVLAGVRPGGSGKQIEIDLIFRYKGTNQVAIAEIKLGDAQGEGPKRGLDQLVMASEREYLGTYTKRFLITARPLMPSIKELALAHRINIIEIGDYRVGVELTKTSTENVIKKIKEKLLA